LKVYLESIFGKFDLLCPLEEGCNTESTHLWDEPQIFQLFCRKAALDERGRFKLFVFLRGPGIGLFLRLHKKYANGKTIRQWALQYWLK
jgi:hypothetical protein